MESDASQSAKIPAPISRPKLALWMFERNLRAPDIADLIGVSSEAVRKYCLPYDDVSRQVPGLAILEKIVALTGGEVRPADFYPPHLSAPRETVSAEAQL